jgi:hypothetical protein
MITLYFKKYIKPPQYIFRPTAEFFNLIALLFIETSRNMYFMPL